MSDRELMRQVLDDLCGARLCSVNSMSSRREAERLIDRAITRLRERLAQQEQERAEVIEQCPYDTSPATSYWLEGWQARAAREWQGLTNEDRNELRRAPCKSWSELLDLVEATLREKNA